MSHSLKPILNHRQRRQHNLICHRFSHVAVTAMKHAEADVAVIMFFFIAVHILDTL